MTNSLIRMTVILAAAACMPEGHAFSVAQCARERPNVLTEVAARDRHFGADAATRTAIARLIASGEKSVTFHLAVLENVLGRAPLPGDQHVVLDGAGSARAVIETTALRRLSFDTVSENETRYEGPGARALKDWRAIHRAFWQPSLEARGRALRGDSEVIVEYFRLVCSADTEPRPPRPEPGAGADP